jgi:hypothetical protein
MGAFNSKQWAEVLTTGSPGSPDASASRTEAADSAPICNGGDDDKVVENNGEEEDRPRPRHLKLQDLDPQSASDNVERTPIEAEENPSESKPDKIKSEADKTEAEADKTEADADMTESDVEDEENDTSGKELLSQELMDTPTGIDKQLHMFKVQFILSKLTLLCSISM